MYSGNFVKCAYGYYASFLKSPHMYNKFRNTYFGDLAHISEVMERPSIKHFEIEWTTYKKDRKHTSMVRLQKSSLANVLKELLESEFNVDKTTSRCFPNMFNQIMVGFNEQMNIK